MRISNSAPRVLEDVRRLPEFSPSTVEITNAPPVLQRPGQQFCQVVQLLGRRFESTWTVTALEPERCLDLEGDVGYGVGYSLREELMAVDDASCRFTLTVEYRLPLGILGRAARRLGVERRARQEAERVLEGLRSLVEEPAQPRSG